MAVRKYFRKQKKRFVRWAKNRYTGPGAVANVVKDVSMLKNLINTEKKYRDVTGISSTITNAAPVILPIISLPSGTGATQRVGNSIRVKSIQMRARIERNPTTASPNANMVRMSLVKDTDPLLGTPVITDIYVNGDPDSLRNIENEYSRRFKVLATRTFILDGVNARTALFNKFLKRHDIVRFASGTATDVSLNQYYWVMHTDSTISGDLLITYGHRIKYIDN